MKEHLAGKRFTNDEDLKDAVVTWLNNQAANWYEGAIRKLILVAVFGFMMLLTSRVISVASYSEREKSDKFCSEALISA